MAEGPVGPGAASVSSEEEVYLAGKWGLWEVVARAFSADPALAGRAVRYVKPSSGWTLLHQAAYWGSKDAARLCLTYGASLDATDQGGKAPAAVATEHGHTELAEWLRAGEVGRLWKPVANPTRRASSDKFSACDKEKSARTADATFYVAYGGGRVEVRAGCRYYMDDWGRVLVGWHGSYDPPADMGGYPLL